MIFENMMSDTVLCPCGSTKLYAECCELFHLSRRKPQTAEELMRSRYSAYALQRIHYIVSTTVPAQQGLLNVEDIAAWSRETEWLGLEILKNIPKIGRNHAQVAFIARFKENGSAQEHQELSAFVKIEECWYFIDPTVPLPTMKQPCICGSGKKFKACCGQFFV
ncbi:YchJ family protein [Neisseria perflava]|uniref:YchJ family protein n=1 Tax=Neisseria perflava TaxID=33053 RepID=UPI0020A075AF|nr:YchJ family protein [Neisseria perflava]MCP1659899.1 SEC-C motif-containing protein [Neisseria perflava]MCP1772254.1 SEC-C motif-containing protein [Neisseria perflava]